MKKSIQQTLIGFKKYAVTILAILTATATITTARADSKPFSRIFVFGDSLSDTGNFHALTGGYPPPPYSEGRFSNGKLWVEYVASALKMEINPGDNYAVAGATTGDSNVNNGLGGLQFPGLLDQIGAFQSAHAPGETSDALFLVWAGANDFFKALATGESPQTLIGNGVGNTAQAILRLRQQGARHIVVVNVPDLGLTPFARNSGMAAQITQLCAAYNQVLANTLDSLAGAGIPTIRADSFATLRRLAVNPTQYGFTNVTDPLLFTGGNPDWFLFWDEVHPTTRGHAALAKEALNQIVAAFSPSQGRGTSPSRINGLHGLVGAKSN